MGSKNTPHKKGIKMKERTIEDKREMSRQTLKANIQNLCEVFLEKNRVKWDYKLISNRKEFIEQLTTFNDNRRRDGYTSLTDTEIAEIMDKLNEVRTTVPIDKLTELQKQMDEAEDLIFEQIAMLKLKLNRLAATAETKPIKAKTKEHNSTL